MLHFDDLPPTLQRLLLVWTEPENWGLTLKDACEKAGINYGTARNQIANVGSHDFYELKARLVDKALAKYHDDILKALVQKAKKGHARAIELYLKATQRLAEKIEVSGSLDINLHQCLVEAKKRAEKLK